MHRHIETIKIDRLDCSNSAVLVDVYPGGDAGLMALKNAKQLRYRDKSTVSQLWPQEGP